jgi:hypothetical protein
VLAFRIAREALEVTLGVLGNHVNSVAKGDRKRFDDELEGACCDWRDTLISAGLANDHWKAVLTKSGIDGDDW